MKQIGIEMLKNETNYHKNDYQLISCSLSSTCFASALRLPVIATRAVGAARKHATKGIVYISHNKKDSLITPPSRLYNPLVLGCNGAMRKMHTSHRYSRGQQHIKRCGGASGICK